MVDEEASPLETPDQLVCLDDMALSKRSFTCMLNLMIFKSSMVLRVFLLAATKFWLFAEWRIRLLRGYLVVDKGELDKL